MFNCTACSLCCKKVKQTIDAAKQSIDIGNIGYHLYEIASFPFSSKEDGSCEMLGEDGRCSIYESRPDICNIETTRIKYFANISKEEYYSLTAASCNQLITEAGIEKKFLINVYD